VVSTEKLADAVMGIETLRCNAIVPPFLGVGCNGASQDVPDVTTHVRRRRRQQSFTPVAN
jgi:hypothetical protein